MTKISIIVPVYKAEKFIRRCIDSILSQSYPNWELLLVDDGSPDNSGAICDEYELKDERIRVFHKQNGGVSSARNFALDRISGEYITFVDSDDWITRDCLHTCIETVENLNLDLLQFGFNKINANSEIIFSQTLGTEVLPLKEYLKAGKFNLCAAGSVLRADIIEKNNLMFDEDIKYGEDQIFMYRYMLYVDRCKSIPQCFYSYFENEMSATSLKQKSSDLIRSIEGLAEVSALCPSFEGPVQKQIQIFLQRILVNYDLNCVTFSKLFKLYYDNRYNFMGSLQLYYKILRVSDFIAYNIYGKYYSVCKQKLHTQCLN